MRCPSSVSTGGPQDADIDVAAALRAPRARLHACVCAFGAPPGQYMYIPRVYGAVQTVLEILRYGYQRYKMKTVSH